MRSCALGLEEALDAIFSFSILQSTAHHGDSLWGGRCRVPDSLSERPYLGPILGLAWDI